MKTAGADAPAADLLLLRFAFQLFEFPPFAFRRSHAGWTWRRPIDAGEPVGDQLLAKVAGVCLHKGKVARMPATASGILFAGANGEGARELLPGEALGFESDLECVLDRSMKILCLFGYAIRNARVGLRGIDKVETKDVFPPCGADVEAIAIVRRVRQVTAVFVGDPLLVSPGDRDAGEQENK